MNILDLLKEFLEDKTNYTTIPDRACWIWRGGYKPGTGYGAIYICGKTHGLHRVSYMVYKGDIPDGICVLHTCDTPRCYNPDHLFLGTKKDNAIDCKMKKRTNVQNVFTPEQIAKIKADKRQQRTIAESYNVSQWTIWAIKSGNKTR